MKGWLTRHPLSAYFFLAYAVSWSIAVPLALQARGVLATNLPWWLHYVTLFGPAVAAFVIARVVREPSGTDVGQRPPTRSIAWWVVGFGSPLLLFVVAQLASLITGQTIPTWRSLGRVNFLPDLGMWAWEVWFIASLGEELGWRGFALPRLQRRHSAMTATLLLSLGWAGWHLPAFFYLPSYAAIGPAVIPGFFLGILAGAIVLTWLYNSSGGSVVAAALWHASFNLVTASPNAAGLTAAVTSTLVMVWAVVIVWRNDWSTLATRRTKARSVRATGDERTRTLPGDALIADSIGAFTHAITIGRPRRDVWPWLAQMGAGTRAGWYSYDVIDNGRRPSVDRIVPELQNLVVGMIFPAVPGATDGFTLLAFEAERFLVLGWVSPESVRLMTWAFVLEDADGAATRLIVRARGGRGYQFHGLPWWAAKPFLTIGHFLMQRKQLLGIAQRVEQRAAG
jgi:membrane protease YdiL (CAAX protease family)